MRVLRGLSSRILPCGCLCGIYETYGGTIVTVIDANGERCQDDTHEAAETLANTGEFSRHAPPLSSPDAEA